MKRFACLLIASLMLAPAHLAHAQTTLELDAQAGRDFLAADHELNAVYQRLLPRLSRAQRTALQKAQLAWIPYRDSWADYVADQYRGGTLSSMSYTSARAELTVARRKDLEHVFAALGHPSAAGEGASARQADISLNDTYQAQRKALDAKGKALQTKGEAAWLAFRDAELAFTTSWAGAGARPGRLDELTRAQVRALQEARQQ